MSTFAKIQDAWVWPNEVERLFRTQAEGHTLHVCSGKSTLGDIRLDADAENGPDVQADMNNLPFPDCSFDTVIADPPWNEIQSIGQKHPLFFELLRVTKANGVVLWNAYSMPSSNETVKERVWVRQDFEEGKCSVIVKYRRFPNQTTLAQTA